VNFNSTPSLRRRSVTTALLALPVLGTPAWAQTALPKEVRIGFQKGSAIQVLAKKQGVIETRLKALGATSANVAEIFRGAVQSIPSAQWEAAQSLAFRRSEIFRLIVLPQCLRRMLPPWMNLYASITMSTSLASLVGVHDVVDTAQIASNTVARTDFTVLVYFALLGLFFAYCYPIARATRALERRHARH